MLLLLLLLLRFCCIDSDAADAIGELRNGDLIFATQRLLACCMKHCFLHKSMSVASMHMRASLQAEHSR
jgi:hypothetical protein